MRFEGCFIVQRSYLLLTVEMTIALPNLIETADQEVFVWGGRSKACGAMYWV